jgi:peptidoglycan hydrolase-like protein with peptidoglycan-binding domain
MGKIKPDPPYEKTYLPGDVGVQRIIDVCEWARGRNQDGYLTSAEGGGILANLKDHRSLRVGTGTTCTPFTATAMGVAFDPTWPRDDDKTKPFVPMFNGGKDPLMPYADFHIEHNSNGKSVSSIVHYNLGFEIKPEEFRRGDFVAIGWGTGNGHGVFCWDAHLAADGKVDAVQYIGANGGSGKAGVTISRCIGKPWLKGDPANGQRGQGTLQKAMDPVFVDSDDIVRHGQWLVLPGAEVAVGWDPKSKAWTDKYEDWLATFRVKPKTVTMPAKTGWHAKHIAAARLWYKGDPPKPFCMKDGPPPPPRASRPPEIHSDAPVTTVKKKDPEAAKTVAPKPAKQDEKKPLKRQKDIEQAMLDFFRAQWIDKDPGVPDEVNDPKSKEAVKAFQRLFGLDDDGVVGKLTWPVIQKQVEACHKQAHAEELLVKLFKGGKITKDPGAANGVNDDQTRAAVTEFQGANGLKATGVPDAETLPKLEAAVTAAAPSASAHGLNPLLLVAYWLGNSVEPKGKAKLRLHSMDVKTGQEFAVFVNDLVAKKEVEAKSKLAIKGPISEAEIEMPADFADGAILTARLTATIDGGKKLEIVAPAPLFVRAGSLDADWRPYIGKDSVPDNVIAAIKKNREKFPMKTFKAAGGKYAGEHHWDYSPPAAHATWAKDYFKKKAQAGGNTMVDRAFLVMLDKEGRPASIQTYDNQIVTWGVGLGGKGDGVHAFEHLEKDSRMKKALDDIGIAFESKSYHVVDLVKKKVISSTKGKPGDDDRHIPPLKAWREQKDLLSAVVGLSEAEDTREAIAESQYAVYITNSTKWPGQDKIHTLALYFMITHMAHWMPAMAKYGFNVQKEFEALGASAPSVETDKKIAQRVANGFVRYAKSYFEKAGKPASYEDVHTRTRTRLWAAMKEDGAKEGFQPGELVYDADIA